MGYVGKVSLGGSTHLVGSTLYGTCSTAAQTAAKVVTCSDFSELVTGVTIHVKFTNGNTASNPTLNVNSKGAKNIVIGGSNVGKWQNGDIVSFTYDGSSWLQNDYNDTLNTTGSADSSSKLFLVGAVSQSSSGVQTFSNSHVYETDGDLSAVSFNGVKVQKNNSNDVYLSGNNDYTVLTIPYGSRYTLGAACAKGIGSVTDGNTDLVTGDAVYDAIAAAIGQATGSMVYQGSVSSANSLLNVSQKAGYVYMADTAFNITDSGSVVHALEVGDMIIFNTDVTPTTQATLWSSIDAYQSNLDRLTDSDIDSAIAEAEAA